MQGENEYENVLRRFYRKSLILESVSEFHPVLGFYFIDALAHIDFSLNTLAYNYQSPRNTMNMQYMRWRIDEEKKEEYTHFGEFIGWLKSGHPDAFASLPMVWRYVYDPENPAGYRSFRIVLDPDSNKPLPPGFFIGAIEEFFDQKFLKSIYKGASLARFYDEFIAAGKS